MNQGQTDFNDILNFYRGVIAIDVYDYETEQQKLTLPVIPQPQLSSLCDQASRIFAQEKMLIEVNCDVVIVGDLHGHILDLFRILNTFGFPPNTNYLFLGDFVDRGSFSTETITLILILKVLYPDNIYIIRGNHEFADMWLKCGFGLELDTIYEDQSIKHDFQRAFSYMPIAAIVNKRTICLHGGLGPTMKSITQFEDISRPLFDFLEEPVGSIVWSDPTDIVQLFKPSNRGSGYFFGSEALLNYLNTIGCDLLVRGHECTDLGTEYALGGKLITVFSASNYCGVSQNNAGVLIIKTNQVKETKMFPPLRYLRRSSATFTESIGQTAFKPQVRISAPYSFTQLQTAARKSIPAVQSLNTFEPLPRVTASQAGRRRSIQRGKCEVNTGSIRLTTPNVHTSGTFEKRTAVRTPQSRRPIFASQSCDDFLPQLPSDGRKAPRHYELNRGAPKDEKIKVSEPIDADSPLTRKWRNFH